MGIPCLGPGSEALTFWEGCVLGTAAGQGEAPRPRGTRVPGPHTQSLTGAGVSAGRRLRRRRRCRRSGETRGPNRKCRPFPPNSPPAPRLQPGSGSRARSPEAPAWRMVAEERRREITPALDTGGGQPRLLPVGRRSLVRTRPLHPLLLRAPPTGFRLGHTLNSGLTLKPRPLD